MKCFRNGSLRIIGETIRCQAQVKTNSKTSEIVLVGKQMENRNNASVESTV